MFQGFYTRLSWLVFTTARGGAGRALPPWRDRILGRPHLCESALPLPVFVRVSVRARVSLGAGVQVSVHTHKSACACVCVSLASGGLQESRVDSLNSLTAGSPALEPHPALEPTPLSLAACLAAASHDIGPARKPP